MMSKPQPLARSIVALVALFFSLSCKPDVPSPNAIAVKPGIAPFVLPSAAQNVGVIQRGEGAIKYELKEPYPAAVALAEIQSAFQTAAWTPLSEDLWNPGLPSSNSAGWGNFVDATKSPQLRVYQWLGYWRNSAGDVVMYGIRYEAPGVEIGSAPVGNGSANVEIFSAAALARARIKVSAR
jgi:hypothetical protein